MTVAKDVPALSDDPCVLFTRLHLYVADRCTAVQTPSGERVALSTWDGPASRGRVKYTMHRFADGTVVLVSQAIGTANEAVPPLPHAVFTDAALAGLAADPAFTD